MHWALADLSGFLPQVVADVIIQDVFTHDVVVPWRDEVGSCLRMTSLTGNTAVAVWDHVPSAKELLDSRLKNGWSPRPSMLKEGDRVVGHAVCIVAK